MKNQAIIVVIILTLFTGCKKYENGPSFSLSSAKGRLCRTWVLKETKRDGNTYYPGANPWTETFKKDGAYEYSNPGYNNVTWDLVNGNKEIDFKGHPQAGDFNYIILKLTNKEFWYYVDNGQGYHMEYHMEAK